MSHVNTIYNQLLQLLPRHEFEKGVILHKGDKYVKYFTCWQQFITLLYAQIRKKDSLTHIIHKELKNNKTIKKKELF